jgi:hypothetical protein
MRLRHLAIAALGLASVASAEFYVKGKVLGAGGAALDSVQVLTRWGLSSDTTMTNGTFEFGTAPVVSLQGKSGIAGVKAAIQGQILSIASPIGARAELLDTRGRQVAAFESGRFGTLELGAVPSGAYVLRIRHAGSSSASSLRWKGGAMSVSLSASESNFQTDRAARTFAESVGPDTTLTFYRRGYMPKEVVVKGGDTAVSVTLQAFSNSSSCLESGKLKLTITESCHLTAGTYSFQGMTFVDSGAVLSMDPGVILKGATKDGAKVASALIVKPGAKIYALGTPQAPVIFTAGTAEPVPGDFAGVVLLGRATENFPGDTAAIEGINNVYYGGANAADNSGELRYVRIEYAGLVIGKDNELNSLTMGGVGSGTRVSYVQAYMGLDDAFEWFGGSASAHHLVSTGTDDDMFDFDAGWNGTLQFAYGEAGATNNDANGIEADNNVEKTQELSPRTNPTVFNMTVIGNEGKYGANRSLNGLRLRRGFAGNLGNILISGGFQYGVAVDGNASYRLVLNDSLKAAGVHVSGVSKGLYTTKVLAGLNNFVPGLSDSAKVLDSVKTIVLKKWMVGDSASMTATGITAANPIPAAIIPGAVAVPAGLAPATYIGAFQPGATRKWHEGWTLPLRAPVAQ